MADVSEHEGPSLAELEAEVRDRISGRGFPCHFARMSLLRGDIEFRGPYRHDDVAGFVSAAYQTTHRIARNPETIGILFVQPPNAEPSDISEDWKIAKRMLTALLAEGATQWPTNATRQPREPDWILWFNNVDCFINVSSPGHTARRSRNIGSAIAFIIQSRSTFDAVGSSRTRQALPDLEGQCR